MRTRSPLEQTSAGGLPPVSGAFVGRARELRRLRALLRSTRLLTVAGPGGAGKSRLAVELGRRTETTVPLRVAGLDAARDTASLLAAVASAVGAEPGTDPATAIGRRRALLVLDGCEHLVDACAELAVDLLRRCPGLRILATSRESLRVPAEVTFRVGGLALPEPGEAEGSHADAVRLFADRAGGRHPGLGHDTATVAEICRRLDGLPLSIELAAHCLPHMSPEELLDSLDDQLALLAEPGRHPVRHRELRATISWSHRLLDPAERAVFRRLSVLSGGFDVATASAVCAGKEVPEDGVLRLLCALENKSLITRADGDAGPVRFRQWECVRAYAMEQLAAAGEVPATRRRAADWFGRQARSLSETLFFADAELDRLRNEPVNLAAAADFYTGAQDADERAALTVALARVHWQQHDHTPARKLLGTVLRPRSRSRYRGEALVWSALAACVQSDHVDALRLANQAVRVARGNPVELAKALDALAFVRMSRGELAEAIDAYRDCLAVVRPLGRPLDIAKCQHCLSWAHLLNDEPEEAERLLAEVVPAYLAMGSRRCQVTALNTLGALRLAQDDVEAAGTAFVEALCTVQPREQIGLDAIDGLAMVAAARGDNYRAVCLAGASAALRERLHLTTAPPWQSWLRAAVDRASARLGSAAITAAATGRAMSEDALRTYALVPSAVDPCGCAGRTDRAGPLSRRELQIAELVADGLTNREIADHLDLAVRTVCTHLTSINNKLGLRSRTQLAVWVVRQPDLMPAPEITPLSRT